MYKSSKGLFSPNITELFGKKNQHQYNLRHNSEYPIPAVNSVYHGNERISLLGPKIYNILPDRLEKIDSLGAFKTEIKSWKSDKCPCRLCRKYIHDVSFI